MDPQNNPSQVPQNAPDNSVIMSVLSYLGILVIIPYITSRNNPSVKFHLRQGLVLLGIEIIAWLLGSFMWSLWPIVNILNLATLVLSIIGIVNVVQKKEKELPLVGKFAHSINI